MHCEVLNCKNKVFRRTYCNKHYRRLIKHGCPHTTKRVANGALQEWIVKHVNYDIDECLPWPFSRYPNGRGQHCHHKFGPLASRVMCFEAHGPPPTLKHEAAHICGKGHEGCVNPKHLVWKTKKENEADKIKHGTVNNGSV